MFKRFTVSALLLIGVFILFNTVLGLTSYTASTDSTLIANTLMHYDYGNVDMTNIMRSNSTLNFKLQCVYDYIITRNNGNSEIDITALYNDNKDNADVVVPSIRTEEFDSRLFKRNGSYRIKIKDVDFSKNGYDYILYNNQLVKLDTTVVPRPFSYTKNNSKYLYTLVEITEGHDDAKNCDYTEYRYNETNGIYGTAIRLFKRDNKVIGYLIL